jgi:hypothetical protein
MITPATDDWLAAEIEDLRAQRQRQQQRLRQWLRHPDPRDPDHQPPRRDEEQELSQ